MFTEVSMREKMKVITAIFTQLLMLQVVFCSFSPDYKPKFDLGKTDYLLIFPRVIRPWTTVKVGVNIYGDKPCNVKVSIKERRWPWRKISEANNTFSPDIPGELELKITWLSQTSGSIQPAVYAKVCGVYAGKRHLSAGLAKKRLSFIETDKPIYKPGQKVMMRIVSINSDLKPFWNKVNQVTIKEPSGSKIMQWNDVPLQDGIASLELQLSKEPVLGIWTISANIKGNSLSTEIEIAKYVLPKFDLVIKPPLHLTTRQKLFTISFCAKYTYGKPVNGELNALVCSQKRFRGKLTLHKCQNITMKINGCRDMTFSLNEFGLSYNYYYKMSIGIEASVIETLTGIKMTSKVSSSSLISFNNALKFDFGKTPSKFKPGFPFNFQVRLFEIDGTPLNDFPIHVQVSRGLFGDSSTKSFYYEKLLPKNGVVTGVLNNMPYNTDNLEFTAIVYLNEKFSKMNYHSAKAIYSPSFSFVHLTQDNAPAEVNRDGYVKVGYTVRNDTPDDIDFQYKIMSQGNMVTFGNITYHRNSSETRPSASPRKDVPAILEELVLKFRVTQAMVPKCRILVYYVRPDKETIADSILYDVEDKLENQVSIKFAEKETRPGTKTKLIIEAKPGSHVAFSVLDKSVLLLKNKNGITKQQIMNNLHELDVEGTGNIYDDLTECPTRLPRPRVDSSEAFLVAGLAFLSNLDIFLEKCRLPEEWLVDLTEGSAVTRVPTTTIASTNSPTYALSIRLSEKPHKPTTKPHKPTTKPHKPKQKPVYVRKEFPETWLWTDMKFDNTSGVQILEVQVPDSITTWIANGFAMSSSFGIGVSDQSSLRTFQPFFIRMNLPYSVIRGEEIPVIISVFNYLKNCVPIKVELNAKSKDYKITSYHINKLCVCQEESIKFRIIPTTIGHISLTVKAQTSQANLCPNTTVLAADAVTRKLLVEPEGIKQEYSKGSFICASGGYNETFDLTLPDEVIPGSLFARVSLIGDVMGPAISNLASLLAMPYGCGEQNMAKFAPNIYIMDYLTNTGQVTEEIKDEAIRYMVSGYQRELTYKRTSGSYSAFGDSDRSGSMMLTAFVLRCYAQARKYIFIDGKEISHTINWFVGKQMSSGCFQNYGRLLNKKLQGGVNSELTITAYVTVALLEAGKTPQNSFMVARAIGCIIRKMNQSLDDPYSTSLVAYTLTLAKHPKAFNVINVLKTKAISKDGLKYWSMRNKGSPSSDVEMTGYALMALIKHESISKDMFKIVNWLTKQRNSYGGFYSTQDTCIALQALSEVAEKFYQPNFANVKVSVKIKPNFSHNFTITSKNKLVLQRVEIPSEFLPNKLELTANGDLCVLMQTTLKYNIPTPKIVPDFDVKINVRQRRAANDEEKTACRPLQMTIKASWRRNGSSNMAIVNVKLVTGFSVKEEQLLKLMNIPDFLKRYEIDGQNVLLYFDEIKTVTFSIDLIQTTLAKKVKPAVVTVYDYYNPESQGEVMYDITEKDCYGDRVEKECPKCMSEEDIKKFFNKKTVNCSSHLILATSKQGMIRVRKTYIKSGTKQKPFSIPYKIPEFCPCEEIYNGVKSVMFSPKNYFEKKNDVVSMVFDSDTTIAMWKAKTMWKLFKRKMKNLYRRCKLN